MAYQLSAVWSQRNPGVKQAVAGIGTRRSRTGRVAGQRNGKLALPARFGNTRRAMGVATEVTLTDPQSRVVSRKRVSDHGEVLTGKREVGAMLDLVKQETERIDSRFLEPACGDGNFLAEILQRKLRVVEARYRKSQLEYERNAVLAVSSIYGIDILNDNVVECRQRLFGIFAETCTRIFKSKTKSEVWDAVKFILERNIIHGDALTLKTADGTHPIVFSEWSFPFNNSFIKRREFSFSALMPSDTRKEDLFSEAPQYSDLGQRAFIPKELKSCPPVHFLKLAEQL